MICMGRYKMLLKKGIVVTIYFLSINSILQVDAYLLDKNITTIPAWIITGLSLLIVISIFLIDPTPRIIFTKIREDNLLLGIFIITFYLCQLPGIILFSGKFLFSRESFFWVYSIILFSYGGLIGLYLRDNIQQLTSLTLIILVSLLLIDLTLFSFSSYTTNRAIGTLRNPNGAAFTIVVLMVSSFRNPIWKLAFHNILLLIISGFGIVLTASMGGAISYVSIIIVIIFLNFLHKQIQIKELLIYLPVIIGFSVISLYFVLDNKLGLTFSNFDINIILSSHNIVARLEGARIAWELFSERPIFGHGMAYVYSMNLGPHNMLLRILVEGGLLGFVGLCVLLGGWLWIAYKRKSYRLFILTTAIFTIGLTTHNLTEDRSLIVLFGMIYAQSQIKRNIIRFSVDKVTG